MAGLKKPVLRKCTGCGQMKDKRSLIRVVKAPEGGVVLDISGRMNGRGAYICRDADCIRKAASAKALEHSLRCRVDRSFYDELLKTSSASDD